MKPALWAQQWRLKHLYPEPTTTGNRRPLKWVTCPASKVTPENLAYVIYTYRKMLDKTLPLAALFQAPTIEQLAAKLQQKNLSQAWSSLVPIQPNGSKPPLFIVHGGGGQVLFCQPLARHLDPEQRLYGFQRRDVGGEYPRHNRIEDMAAHYIQEMRSLQPEGPYYLAGYCIGVTIAFKMGNNFRLRARK